MSFTKLAECCTLLFVMALDLVFTLVGQPDDYWGDYDYCEESNPVGNALLISDPIHFIAFSFCWAIVVFCAIVKLPKTLSRTAFIFLLLKHSSASASWLPRLFSDYLALHVDAWYLSAGYFAVISMLYGFWLHVFGEPKKSTDLL